jgi:hypothetical protein
MYEVGIASNSTLFTPSFVKTDQLAQKLNGGTDRHTHYREQCDLVSLLSVAGFEVLKKGERG